MEADLTLPGKPEIYALGDTGHLWYLIGFQNRLLVFIRWSFSFATHGRGARLIASQRDVG